MCNSKERSLQNGDATEVFVDVISVFGFVGLVHLPFGEVVFFVHFWQPLQF